MVLGFEELPFPFQPPRVSELHNLRDTTALLAQLKSRRPGLRAIFMTSYGSAALREEVMSGGFFAYFGKPFDNADLIAAAEAAILESVTP